MEVKGSEKTRGQEEGAKERDGYEDRRKEWGRRGDG